MNGAKRAAIVMIIIAIILLIVILTVGFVWGWSLIIVLLGIIFVCLVICAGITYYSSLETTSPIVVTEKIAVPQVQSVVKTPSGTTVKTSPYQVRFDNTSAQRRALNLRDLEREYM